MITLVGRQVQRAVRVNFSVSAHLLHPLPSVKAVYLSAKCHGSVKRSSIYESRNSRPELDPEESCGAIPRNRKLARSPCLPLCLPPSLPFFEGKSCKNSALLLLGRGEGQVHSRTFSRDGAQRLRESGTDVIVFSYRLWILGECAIASR